MDMFDLKRVNQFAGDTTGQYDVILPRLIMYIDFAIILNN